MWESILGEKPKQAADSNVIGTLFEFRIKLHLMHLATDSFAVHKALNKAYEAVNDFIDSFAEMFMGAKGSKDLVQSIGTINADANGDPITVVSELEAFLKGPLADAIGSDETALLNLRDDLLGKIQTVKYLLTLK
jgi:hypothetical protein